MNWYSFFILVLSLLDDYSIQAVYFYVPSNQSMLKKILLAQHTPIYLFFIYLIHEN